MSEIKKAEKTDFISLAVAIAIISEECNLNVKEFSSMLEALGRVTNEQCEMIGAICSAFKMRDVMENQTGQNKN